MMLLMKLLRCIYRINVKTFNKVIQCNVHRHDSKSSKQSIEQKLFSFDATYKFRQPLHWAR